MTIYVSLLVCIAGALIYALAANAKFQELGRLSFFAGLLAFLLGFSGHAISLVH